MKKYAETDNDEHAISASQIKTHAQCPLQYWLRYIKGMEASKKDSDYITLGSRVHEAIEEALKSEKTPPLNHEEAVQAAIQNSYRDLDDEYPLPDDMYSTGMECCEKAAEYLAKREPDILGVEHPISFNIDRSDMDTPVRGIMDVATSSEIWDWKTGRIRDDTGHEEKIQGSVYMAGYYNEFGHEPDQIRFIYVKEGKVRSLDPSDDNWNYMLSNAKKLMHAKKEGEFPGNPGDLCRWCSYEYWCPEAPAGYGNVPWEEY